MPFVVLLTTLARPASTVHFAPLIPTKPVVTSREVHGRKVNTPILEDVSVHTGVTLGFYAQEFGRANKDLAELASILASVQTACKSIRHYVQQSELIDMMGTGSPSLSPGRRGEDLRRVADSILRDALRFTGRVGVLASGERSAPEEVPLPARHLSLRARGPAAPDDMVSLVATFSPLDAPEEGAAGLPVGTIFGIFAEAEECLVPENGDPVQACVARALRPGTSLLAAGYCLYSSSCHLVLSLGAGTHRFTLDRASGEFVLSQAEVSIPASGTNLCVPAGGAAGWDEAFASHVRAAQEAGSTVRTTASAVADMHRVLLGGGGLLAIPADDSNPNGRLRLLYEAAPLAFLAEQACGSAVTGLFPVLSITPSTLDQKSPMLVGSRDDVADVVRAYERAAARSPALKTRCEDRLEGRLPPPESRS